jgi:hypothetical protein
MPADRIGHQGQWCIAIYPTDRLHNGSALKPSQELFGAYIYGDI